MLLNLNLKLTIPAVCIEGVMAALKMYLETTSIEVRNTALSFISSRQRG